MTPTPIPLPSLALIEKRLAMIFPGDSHETQRFQSLATARTIFVMFYANAISGNDQWIRPSMVTDMTERQARQTRQEERERWVKRQLAKKRPRTGFGWYAANTREFIRDEILQYSLKPLGAIVVRDGVEPTSSHPRYALAPMFASLFNPRLRGSALVKMIPVFHHLCHQLQKT